MFDVFYIGAKPNLFPHEQEVTSVQEAQQRSRTRYCWIVTYLADYSGWDFLWEPVPWQSQYIHVWPSQWHEYSGTFLVPKAATDQYHFNQKIIPNKSSRENWKINHSIDETQWDWTWAPHPMDPPYIYVFGNQWNPPEFKASIKYHVEGATEIKYMEPRTRRMPQPAAFEQRLPVAEFDYSWEPNPFDPPMDYVFGNQWNPGVLEPTVVYHVEGATETKYVDDIVAKVAPDKSRWELLDDIEEFDYSWRPDPTDPPYIYVFGNQWLAPEQRPALQYRVAGATEIKYMDTLRARRVGDPSKFVQLYPAAFDWSWEPDPGAPPYKYVFGNQYYSAEVMPTIEYNMSGATEVKYKIGRHV